MNEQILPEFFATARKRGFFEHYEQKDAMDLIEAQADEIRLLKAGQFEGAVKLPEWFAEAREKAATPRLWGTTRHGNITPYVMDLREQIRKLTEERDAAQKAYQDCDEELTRHSTDRVNQRAELAAAQARIRALGEQLEADRTKVADCITAANHEIDSRHWLTEGRGSYEWNDDRWHQEFYAAAIAIKAALEPMTKIAADWSACPLKAEDIAQARIDLQARIGQMELDKTKLLDYIQGDLNVKINDTEVALVAAGLEDWGTLAHGVNLVAAQRNEYKDRIRDLEVENARVTNNLDKALNWNNSVRTVRLNWEPKPANAQPVQDAPHALRENCKECKGTGLIEVTTGRGEVAKVKCRNPKCQDAPHAGGKA